MNHKKELRNIFKNCIIRYYDRLKIELTDRQIKNLSEFDNSEITLSEHGLMWPWIGIYRLPVMMASTLKDSEISIFIINDHHHRREQPWTRDLNFYSKGMNSKKQKKPAVIRIPRNKPLHICEIPEEQELERLKRSIIGTLSQNRIWFESNFGRKVSKHKLNLALGRLNNLFLELSKSKEKCNTYSDWLSRFNIRLIQKTNPEIYDKILFLSYSDLVSESKEFRSFLMSKSNDLIESIRSTISYQKKRDMDVFNGGQIEDSYLPFWFYCPKCNRRNRVYLASHKNEAKVSFYCCNSNFESHIETDEIFVALDVISIETLTGLLGIKKRIVGAIKDYGLVVDRILEEVFDTKPPLRELLNVKPVFIGIGTSEHGAEDATVFSTLIEVDYSDFGSKIVTDEWLEKPTILSDLI